jgi:hypothetical protein
MSPRSNADLLGLATRAGRAVPETAPEYTPDPQLERLIERRDFLLAQPSLHARETRELAGLVQAITRAEDGRRRPITHGASGYRRGCKCAVCLEGHADRHARHRERRLGLDG